MFWNNGFMLYEGKGAGHETKRNEDTAWSIDTDAHTRADDDPWAAAGDCVREERDDDGRWITR